MAVSSHALRDRILAAGQRITPQRDLIAGVLERAEGPLAAQELCKVVERADPSIGRATVFRTLQSLQEAGIVEHVTLVGNQVAYLLCAIAGHHHHLVCRHCGVFSDLPEAEVAPFLTRVEKASGFTVDHATFNVYGRCSACARARIHENSRTRSAPEDRQSAARWGDAHDQ